MPKPIIRLGTTSISSSVSRMILIALSMSSNIFAKPCSRCSRSAFLVRSKKVRRLTHSTRKAIHSSSSAFTPSTLGEPPMSTLKLQA